MGSVQSWKGPDLKEAIGASADMEEQGVRLLMDRFKSNKQVNQVSTLIHSNLKQMKKVHEPLKEHGVKTSGDLEDVNHHSHRISSIRILMKINTAERPCCLQTNGRRPH